MKRVLRIIFGILIVFPLRAVLTVPFLTVQLLLSLVQIVIAYVALPFHILSVWLMFIKEGKFNYWWSRAKLESQKTHSKVVGMFSVKN